MNDEYCIIEDDDDDDDAVSPMKAVNLRLQFLAKNDPLVMIQSECNGEETKGGEHEISNNVQRKGVDKENQDSKRRCFALWIYCDRMGNDKKSALNRVVIEGSDSLKNVIVRDLLPQLKDGGKEEEKQNKNVNGERDRIFDSICKSYTFHIMGGLGSKTTLSKEVLKRPDIISSLSPDMWLCVSFPPK